MPWRQVAFVLESARAGLAEAALEAAGALSVTWAEAPGSEAVLEPAPGRTELWHRLRVIGLFPLEADPEAIREQIGTALGRLPDDWQQQELEDEQWERAWLAHFKPLHCGGNLWVLPLEADAPDPQAINLRLDPGLAFGTGTHPSTFLCLQSLAADPPRDERVIDYGCGSGLLAIAALKLGAREAIAIDHDPQARLATLENARRNGVEERIRVAGPEAALPDADRLLANILAGVLEMLAPRLIAALRPGGRITLAGVLAEQAASVRAAYTPACAFDPMVARDGWVRLDGRRSSL